MTFAAAALAMALAGAHGGTPPPSALAIRHVDVIDVATGQVAEDRTVLVDGARITAVLAAGGADRSRARVEVDGRRRYLIPGLWDMHVHLADASYLSRLVAAGVTGVRDMGGGLDTAADGCESLSAARLLAWRADIAAGERIGPRIILSGPALSGTGWSTSLPARTPDEAGRSVTALAALGVDFVKVYEKIPLDAYQALARAAREHGLPFAGHVPEDHVSLLQAVQAGQRSIEHVRAPLLACAAEKDPAFDHFMREDGWSAADQAWGRERRAECSAVFTAAQNGPVWFTPTLVVEQAKVGALSGSWDSAKTDSWLPAPVRRAHLDYAGKRRAQSPSDRASDARWWEAQQTLVARLAKQQVALLAGTDSACQGGSPGASLHEELALMVAAGVPVQRALAAATLEPARYFGAPRSGIVPGAPADLVLLGANPLVDIRHTRDIQGVVLAGRWLDRDALDRLDRRQDARE